MRSVDIVIDPSAVEVYNSIADFIQSAAAGVLGEISGNPIDPNSLPLVRLADNERTRATLSQLKPWTTPLSLGGRPSPFGTSIEKIEIHPNAVVQRAFDLMGHFGGQNKAVQKYIEIHKGVRPETALRHFVDQVALQLIATYTVDSFGQKIEPEIINRVIGVALDTWDAQHER